MLGIVVTMKTELDKLSSVFAGKPGAGDEDDADDDEGHISAEVAT